MSNIRKVAILGERCSGTNFLEKVVKNSFNLPVIRDTTTGVNHKHWIVPENYADRTKTDDTLYIGIVRDPVQWLSSFFRKKYHVPLHMRTDIRLFLGSEWYSINDEGDHKEIMLDRHPYTKERFKNIFELRQVKCKFLLNDMPKLVKNYLWIRYEDLLHDMPATLSKLSLAMGLPILRDSTSLIRLPKPHFFAPDIQKLINSQLDRSQESTFNYFF